MMLYFPSTKLKIQITDALFIPGIQKGVVKYSYTHCCWNYNLVFSKFDVILFPLYGLLIMVLTCQTEELKCMCGVDISKELN